MCVKLLLYWQPNSGGQVSIQTRGEVLERIEKLHGVYTGTWHVFVSIHRPILRDQATALPQGCARELLGLTFSEVPSKGYFVLRSERMVEADESIGEIMFRIRLYPICFDYVLGNFRIKLGTVLDTHDDNLCGMVLEVEYAPISSIEQTDLLFKELGEFFHEVDGPDLFDKT